MPKKETKEPTFTNFLNQACKLPLVEFELIVRELHIQRESREVQIKAVAGYLQHQWREKQAQKTLAKLKIDVPDLADFRERAFNALAFALWSMPQKNPIPKEIFEKMRYLNWKRKRKERITEAEDLTLEERAALASTLKWIRGSDQFGITITGNIDHGIVFGQDRLALIWVITQAIKARQPQLIGFTMAEYLDFYGLPKGGRAYDEAEERFERLKSSLITAWWTDSQGKRFELMTNYLSDFMLVRPIKMEKKPEKGAKNLVSLSAMMWTELAMKRFVRLDAQVVRNLKDYPGALDLYQFVAAKIFRLSQGQRIIIPLDELAFQLGMKSEQTPFHIRETIKKWIGLVTKETGWRIELRKAGDRDILVVYLPTKKLPPANCGTQH